MILCPATLLWQWQVELKDRLGIPSAVWSKKQWVDAEGRVVRTRGAEDVVNPPCAVAIVSTGLLLQDTLERKLLSRVKVGTLVLDEAHKARTRGGPGGTSQQAKEEKPGRLLDFMRTAAGNARHVLLGTVTPIQTRVDDLWDLLSILSSGVDFVTGAGVSAKWEKLDEVQGFITGKAEPADLEEAWDLFRNPLPARGEPWLAVAGTVRDAEAMADLDCRCIRSLSDLDPLTRTQLESEVMEKGFFAKHNPVLRHTVLRKRGALEADGLLERVGVDVHPVEGRGYGHVPFVGLGLMTNQTFANAYEAAEAHTTALAKRKKSAGFMRSLVLQRICSGFASGLATAQRLLDKGLAGSDEEEEVLFGEAERMSTEEADALRRIIDELSQPEARDPKLHAVLHFLNAERVPAEGNRSWLELGCIVFSQYHDTSFAVAERLSRELPAEPVALYAGAGRSRLFLGGLDNEVAREEIKARVKEHRIRLVVATDAACEGLNLQTLGTLVNVDLPWNPSRLEQRLGRIERFGQRRKKVDMLNLVYRETRDEDVYTALSRRMRNVYDVFGSLPETIEDDWIDGVEAIEAEMDKYLDQQKRARHAFDVKHRADVDPEQNRWELCSRVLYRRDVEERMSRPWR